MIITLVKADFSANNIGTLSSFAVLTNILNATYDGPTSVAKGEAFSATITMHDGYTIPETGISISMGGVTLTDAYTISDNVATISIAAVTGVVVINMVAEVAPEINCGLTLVQGYNNASNNGTQANRVRTAPIYGSYKLSVNGNYRIRFVTSGLDDVDDVAGTKYSDTSTTLTSIDVVNEGKYSIITFANADAALDISPDEDIIATFEPYTPSSYELGDPIETTLSQGYVLASTNTSNDTATHRVKTGVITGPFRIEPNDGFIIRGVTTSANENGYTDGIDLVTNAALTIYDCTNECLGYTVVTFADATDATAAISPDSDMIKNLQAYNVV